MPAATAYRSKHVRNKGCGVPGRLPRLGIHDPSRGAGGPSRYVGALLGGLDPQEVDVFLLGRPSGPYAGDPRFAAAEPPIGGLAETMAGRPPGTGRVLAGRVWRSAAPATLRSLAGVVGETRRLARVFRPLGLDLLHTNSTGCEEAPIAARLARVPRVLGTFHVDSTYDLRGARSGVAYRALERASNRSLHRAIAVSEATKRDWVRRTGMPAEKVVTIHNGVDPDAFRRRTGAAEARRGLGLPGDETLLLGGVGRLDEAKGFADLIDAVACLGSAYPRLALAIAGDGPLRGTLQQRCTELGIADRVFFLGFRQDAAAVFEALDVFVFPSLCETIGYALLEAMALELPAVGSLIGGIPEVIVPGETGVLVPPRDPLALAAALRPLLDSPELRRRMGLAGRARVVRHFHQRDTVRKTIDVYREMLGTGAWDRREPWSAAPPLSAARVGGPPGS